MTEGTKRCSGCEAYLPATDFYRRKDGGLSARCKPCARQASADWYAANKERAAEGARRRYLAQADRRRGLAIAYRQANIERVRAYDRERKKAEPERWAAYYRQYRLANLEKVTLRDRARKAAQPERLAEYNRLNYLANREVRLASMKAWRAANPQAAAELSRKKKAIKRAATIMAFGPAELDGRMSMFGHRCWMCGGPFEHVDHVKPLSKGGAHCLANLRPACSACNTRKGSKWPWPTTGHQKMPFCHESAFSMSFASCS